MDITVQREALLKPLQALSGVVERKQTMPMLSNILLTAEGDQLSLTGTDLEVELVGFAALHSLTVAGKITVSARKLLEICRTLPEGILIRLSLEKKYLAVRAGKSEFMLNTLPVNEFPSLETAEYPVSLTIKQFVLKDLFTKTHFAMGQQDVRHFFNGAYLDIKQGSIRCVAADGHRLAISTYTNSEAVGDAFANIILPRKSVLELMKLLSSDSSPEVTLHIGDKRLKALMPDFIFTTKLINAQYPDYNRLIPRKMLGVVGDKELIKQALTRASILSNEKFRGIRFQLEENKLRISANNADQEHAEEAVVLSYQGQNIDIGFNVAYLLDVMSAITGKMLRCSFADPNSGVLLESEEGDGSMYVIMPMRI